jgi:hypothetical protein
MAAEPGRGNGWMPKRPATRAARVDRAANRAQCKIRKLVSRDGTERDTQRAEEKEHLWGDAAAAEPLLCRVNFGRKSLSLPVTEPMLTATDPPRLFRPGNASGKVMRNAGWSFLPAHRPSASPRSSRCRASAASRSRTPTPCRSCCDRSATTVSLVIFSPFNTRTPTTASRNVLECPRTCPNWNVG